MMKLSFELTTLRPLLHRSNHSTTAPLTQGYISSKTYIAQKKSEILRGNVIDSCNGWSHGPIKFEDFFKLISYRAA